jgi:hypothetical protein
MLLAPSPPDRWSLDRVIRSSVRTVIASTAPRTRAAPSARDIAVLGADAPVKACALLGLAWVALIAYVFIGWVTSSYFGPTPTGSDIPPVSTLRFIRGMEIVMTASTAWLIWECILKPIWRDGEIGTDGLLVITWFTLWFHDTMLNWTVHVFSYNAYAVNFGNWTQEIPGWVSPLSNRVPEPVLALGMSYIALCSSGAWAAMYTMQYLKQRWPQTSHLTLIASGLAFGMFADWAAEHTMVTFQLMAYLSTVPSLTLLSGQLNQFPLYEAFFFGGVVGFTGVIIYYKDDRGYTWAERGVDKLRIARVRGMKTLIRWLAMMGLFHSVMFFFYSVPMQLFSINGGPFPKDVPSYLLNGICGEGTPYACASPHAPMPRRMGEAR